MLQLFIGMAGVACRGFVVCVVGNKSKDIGMGIRKSIQCGVIPTLFGCFLGIPSLYVLSILNAFFVTCFGLFFWREKSMVAVLQLVAT